MSVQIDYATIAIISVLSGFGGAIGTEMAKAIISELRLRHRNLLKSLERESEDTEK